MSVFMSEIDPVFLPLPESARPSLSNTPNTTLRLPQVPAHPPPGVAPLSRFRSERLLPAPNLMHPLPPTYAHVYITPNSSVLGETSEKLKSNKAKKSPDRFIPTAHSLEVFHMSMPLALLSPEEKLLRRTVANDIFGRGRSKSPPPNSTAINYRSTRSDTNGITAAGRAIYVGAGSSRGTEFNIKVCADYERPERERVRHETRLAAALGVDRCARVLSFGQVPTASDLWSRGIENCPNATRKQRAAGLSCSELNKNGVIPSTPFRVLDAPGLRDDYYCSLLAFSPVSHSLAVGLHSDVYTWTESNGAAPFEHWSTSHITCLAFSGKANKKNILAIGRIDGNLCLWKPGEKQPRIERLHTAGIACISWRPTVQRRWDPSFTPVNIEQEMLPRLSHSWNACDDLLVGDEMGVIYYYTVVWSDIPPPIGDRRTETVGTKIRLLKKIVAHTQQICGLGWSPDGLQFSSGGNDNVASLFNVEEVFMPSLPDESIMLRQRREKGKYRWIHGAAVKAIAFCPWQKALLATGGGSNDRAIHFYHTYSGACLATINVSAQVTSLLWSDSHREIAATYGYANPDHPYRIAVFSWPECQQVANISWGEDMRALYAVGYPGGPLEDCLESDDYSEYMPQEDPEEDWMSIERHIIATGTLSIRAQENASVNPGEDAETRTGMETPRGRVSGTGTVIDTVIPATTTARTSRNTRSRSRGRTGSRNLEMAPQVPRVSGGTRNSSSAAQAASLRRRRTRSGHRATTKHSNWCIVVAASDETVRFHEVWSGTRKGIVGWRGVLGGSDILEGLEGIEKDGGIGETIR